MDEKLYSQETIDKYMNENFFFKDNALKMYYDQGDVTKFRQRLVSKFPKKSLENMVYVYVTDSVRDIIYEIIGKLSKYLKKSGDMILSGGDAVNYYLLFGDKVVTSDIDTKFIPRMKIDRKFFGKLQAIKLLLWDQLGKISKTYGQKIKTRLSKQTKLGKFLGISFTQKEPYVTRRYTLKSKKKISKTNKPAMENILIDVEIFALDLKVKYFSIEDKKVSSTNLGGILDIAFMRPDEFGHEITETKSNSGFIYTDSAGKFKKNPNIVVAKRRFLVEDIYLMQALGLRPHKKQKDKERMLKLLKTYPILKSVKSRQKLSALFKKYQRSPVSKTARKNILRDGKVSIAQASKINPHKYEKYTTQPSKDKLKKLTYGSQEKKVGYKETKSNMRFDVKTNRWVINKRNEYVKNEYKYRINKNNVKTPKSGELYGFKLPRNSWVPNKIIKNSGAIPFIGLKK